MKLGRVGNRKAEQESNYFWTINEETKNTRIANTRPNSVKNKADCCRTKCLEIME